MKSIAAPDVPCTSLARPQVRAVQEKEGSQKHLQPAEAHVALPMSAHWLRLCASTVGHLQLPAGMQQWHTVGISFMTPVSHIIELHREMFKRRIEEGSVCELVDGLVDASLTGTFTPFLEETNMQLQRFFAHQIMTPDGRFISLKILQSTKMKLPEFPEIGKGLETFGKGPGARLR